MTNKDEQKKAPELRFKGFIDDWEQGKLSEIININSGKDYKHLNIGNIPVYGTGGYMTSVDDYLYQDNAVGIGRKGTIDQPQFLNGPFWTVDTLFYCTPKNKINIEFIYFIFQRIPWKKYDESTGVPSLSKKTISSISVHTPTNDEEINAITKLFLKSNKIITLYKRKLELLEELKKGYLQQMFPAKDEVTPTLRFENFEDSWNKFKIKEFAKFLTGRGLSWKDITDNGLQECILYGNLYTDYGMITDNIIYSTNTQLKNPVYSKYGDVLIPASDTTPTGLARATSIEVDNILIGSDINIIRPNDNVNGSFLSLAINTSKRELIRLIKGSTVRHIHNADIENVPISLPDKEEQVLLVKYFKLLNEMTVQYTKRIKSIENIHKELLNKMFI